MYPVEQDQLETSFYGNVAAVSAAVTFLMHCVLCYFAPFLARRISNRLTVEKQYRCLSCVPSTIHALVTTTISVYTLWTGVELYKDFLWGRYWWASVGCSITVGYMAGDLFYACIMWKYLGDIGFVFHHLASFLAFLYVINTGTYLYFSMIRLFAEFSTPFVNFRLVLYELDMQSSSAYFYNGILMVMSFMLCRIVPFPFFIYSVYLVYGTEAFKSTAYGQYLLYMSIIVLDTMNALWFRKMLLGASKILEKRKESEAQLYERGKGFKQG